MSERPEGALSFTSTWLRKAYCRLLPSQHQCNCHGKEKTRTATASHSQTDDGCSNKMELHIHDMLSRYTEQQAAVMVTLVVKDVRKNMRDIITLSDDMMNIELITVVLEFLRTITTMLCEAKNPTISLICLVNDKSSATWLKTQMIKLL